ncbi:MAG: copper-containing nitrite reductase [Verrucomicrobiota bacterium]
MKQEPTPKRIPLLILPALAFILGVVSCDNQLSGPLPAVQSHDQLVREVTDRVMARNTQPVPALPAAAGGGKTPGTRFITSAADPDAPLQGEEVAILTDPPLVPPAITRKHPSRVKVRLEVKELEKQMTDGTTYTYWTFGGTVPGKFIRVRQNDEVEFTLANHPDSKMPHNIDLHAVTGQGGGAAASMTAPGHESVFSFKALNPGLFIYHCATAPVGMHIGNGMYGLIFVEPREGLPAVDKEFYVCQGDFYTKGKFGEPGLQPFDMEKALHEQPDYVVFNGSVGAIAGDNALTAKTGETVRLFMGNGGPNLSSSFHVIGEIFDNVYPEGGDTVNHNVQTTMIPAGGSAIVDFKLEVPGTYILVDHAIFRAFNKGAIGMLKVTGNEDKLVYSGKTNDLIYQAEGSDIQVMPLVASTTPKAGNKAERIAAGKTVYARVCIACHQAEGQGVPMAFPPLAASDFLNADADRAIHTVLNGMTGEVTVNGVKFNSVMPKLDLSDDDVSNVLSYVYSSFGNKGTEVLPDQVKAVRALPPVPVNRDAH